ncbi:MAG TPA: SigE family RNA polymerase sigma factor [Trebonia sp.]|jgi:RNA polymerase sigma-70 factor (sigma-E family)|nr:SigE family RNA polymerase sigma factor [Trebonia sp.]
MRPDLEESFASFVRRRGDHHLRVAMLLTGSAAEAEDLVQASLIRLYRAWPRLDIASSSADAYLRKIIVNTRRSWWRARWRQEAPMASVPDRADPAEGGGDPADRQALGSLVRSALARLPRQQRAVLVLRYLEDLPEAEVAALLGCSVGSVKTHAHRGLRALRGSLGERAEFTEFGRVAVNETAGPGGEKR